MAQTILYDPLLPWMVISGFGLVALLIVAFSWWQGLSGWWLRALSGAILIAALANPSLQQEERDPLNDIVLVMVDETASQQIGGRATQTAEALAALEQALSARPDTDYRIVRLRDSSDDRGSLMMAALNDALNDIARSRLAGVVLLSDGQLHDVELAPELDVPIHLLQTGRASDWDRRITIINAPAFSILGEPVTITVQIDDLGAGPGRDVVGLNVSLDGEFPTLMSVPVGEPVELPLTLPHGGINTIQFTTDVEAGELTERNNSAIVRINGVRDRLRVLLVSGEPHPGERTWRNLLKSDSSVDLVHFTILRPPEKQDGVPVNELSLIAFPTRELFLEKIYDFDLIIFDRYRRRGILPAIYLDNVRDYVTNGGAVLLAAGPGYASADSLYHSDLADVLPGFPTARVIEGGFTPEISEIGQRHPVTEGLETYSDARRDGAEEDTPPWGRWFRLVELDVRDDEGQVVMTDGNDRPLLALNRAGEGRIALLASDHSWLWSRGYEGGGPQLELLRRLAHWMMKEPELEEDALWAEPRGQTMQIIRRTLGAETGPVTITTPSGEKITVPLTQVAPGRFETMWEAPEIGLYRLEERDRDAVVALGPSSPREFIETIATGEVLDDVLAAGRATPFRLETGNPGLRNIRAGRPSVGRGWIGLVPQNAYVTTDVTLRPLLPAWLALLLTGVLMIGGWLREGRR